MATKTINYAAAVAKSNKSNNPASTSSNSTGASTISSTPPMAPSSPSQQQNQHKQQITSAESQKPSTHHGNGASYSPEPTSKAGGSPIRNELSNGIQPVREQSVSTTPTADNSTGPKAAKSSPTLISNKPIEKPVQSNLKSPTASTGPLLKSRSNNSLRNKQQNSDMLRSNSKRHLNKAKDNESTTLSHSSSNSSLSSKKDEPQQPVKSAWASPSTLLTKLGATSQSSSNASSQSPVQSPTDSKTSSEAPVSGSSIPNGDHVMASSQASKGAGLLDTPSSTDGVAHPSMMQGLQKLSINVSEGEIGEQMPVSGIDRAESTPGAATNHVAPQPQATRAYTPRAGHSRGQRNQGTKQQRRMQQNNMGAIADPHGVFSPQHQRLVNTNTYGSPRRQQQPRTPGGRTQQAMPQMMAYSYITQDGQHVIQSPLQQQITPHIYMFPPAGQMMSPFYTYAQPQAQPQMQYEGNMAQGMHFLAQPNNSQPHYAPYNQSVPHILQQPMPSLQHLQQGHMQGMPNVPPSNMLFQQQAAAQMFDQQPHHLPQQYPPFPQQQQPMTPQQLQAMQYAAQMQMSPDREEQIQRQIQYYFSRENLVKDMYLREQMNAKGYVPIEKLLKFKRLSQLANSAVEVERVARNSPVLQVKDRAIRSRYEWYRFTLPPQLQYENQPESSSDDADQLPSINDNIAGPESSPVLSSTSGASVERLKLQQEKMTPPPLQSRSLSAF